MHRRFVSVLGSIEEVELNIPSAHSPYILSFSAAGTKAEILQRLLCERGVLIGLGSACASKQRKNRVLMAMGRTMSHIEGSARISFSPQNLTDDLQKAEADLRECIHLLLHK